MFTIVFTGGHVTPALAVIDELRRQQKHVNIIFYGRTYTSRTETTSSYEYQEVASRAIPFVSIDTGRLQRHSLWGAVKGVVHLMRGIGLCMRQLKHTKPDLVMTFGGYIGLTVAIAAYLCRIPVVMHEQTICPGLSNRIIALFARLIFISYPQSKRYLGTATIWSGNPIRHALLTKQAKPFFTRDQSLPLLYVTGASLGSHSINVLIESILPELLQRYEVVIQTGSVAEYGDYERLSRLRHTLSAGCAKRLHVYQHLEADQVAYMLQHASLAISRAGANSVTELIACRMPSILIPLPWAAYDEQRKHARWMQRQGVSVMVEQDTSAEKLLRYIHDMVTHLDDYKSHFTSIHEGPFNSDAPSIIAQKISSV